jgi:hypothetical protein
MHALYRVCATVHVLYPDVNKLAAANGKKIFVILPARRGISETNLHANSPNSSNDTLGKQSVAIAY